MDKKQLFSVQEVYQKRLNDELKKERKELRKQNYKKMSSIQSYMEQVKDFVNMDLLKAESMQGVSLQSDPLHNTRTLYKQVLVAAIKRAK